MEAVSSDGSPVEAWAALPAEPELATVRQLIAGRRRVLDLGAGTGRIADPLTADGCYVVAVDDSEAMLSRVVAATTVCSRIEELNLGERFDAVLLLSHLINSPEPLPLLLSAARHLSADGLLIVERLAPGRRWQEGSSNCGVVEVSLTKLTVELPRITARTTYGIDDRFCHQD